jgi:hypothetical protein
LIDYRPEQDEEEEGITAADDWKRGGLLIEPHLAVAYGEVLGGERWIL